MPMPFLPLWALTLLLHQAAYGALSASAEDALLAVLALAVVIRPSARLGTAMALVHVAVVLRHLPLVYNHWFFAGLVSLGLAVAGLRGWRRGTFDGFPAAGRASLVLLYLLSGFHKLNHDFLDPAVSCGAALYGQLHAALPLLPDVAVAGRPIIVATLLLELGLPLLLLLPRTRTAAVALGVLFHLGMGIAGYPRFSLTGIALLTLFAPPRWFAGRVPRWWRVGESTGTKGTRDGTAAGAGTRGPQGGATDPSGATEGPRVAAPVIALIAPLLVLLAGVGPYLGLWTDRAFAMYSNLRTEGGRSNHLLVGAAGQPFGYQRDLVRVLEGDTPVMRLMAAEGLEVPFEELRARLTEERGRVTGPIPLRWQQRGVARYVADVRVDTSFALPVPGWQGRFLRFRPVEPSGPRRCSV